MRELDERLFHGQAPHLELEPIRYVLVYHQAVLRGRPRFFGANCLSTICARMSMDSAKYVAFSSGLLVEPGTPAPWLVFASRPAASGSWRSRMVVSSVSACCWRSAIT